MSLRIAMYCHALRCCGPASCTYTLSPPLTLPLSLNKLSLFHLLLTSLSVSSISAALISMSNGLSTLKLLLWLHSISHGDLKTAVAVVVSGHGAAAAVVSGQGVDWLVGWVVGWPFLLRCVLTRRCGEEFKGREGAWFVKMKGEELQTGWRWSTCTAGSTH
eukprot:356989-Chlamydomonas_euryale.AAC.1